MPPISLPGLDRLISTCRAHHLRLELDPPVDAANPQDMLLGQPLDPMLAAVLSRFNGMSLAELSLYSLDQGEYGLGPFNASMRRSREPPLREVLLYGVFSGFAYFLAAVPPLADSNGIQPVVYIINDSQMEVMPIASSVDLAFDLYARYLGVLATNYGSIEAGQRALEIFFPRSIPDLVAEDRRLVQMLKANRFDAFTSVDPDLPKWSESIQRAAGGRA